MIEGGSRSSVENSDEFLQFCDLFALNEEVAILLCDLRSELSALEDDDGVVGIVSRESWRLVRGRRI